MVLNGMDSKKERASESRRLMDFMFREFKKYDFFAADEVIDHADVWLGAESHVPLMLDGKLSRVMSRTDRARTEIRVSWSNPAPAPITKGQQLGVLEIVQNDNVMETLALRAGTSVEELGMFDRIGAALKYLILGAPPQQNPVQ